MIEIDYRRGSGEFERLFIPYGIKVKKTTLSFGDFAWTGNSARGMAYIGVERKDINDLITCIKDDRFAGYQLQGMAEQYDIGYLIVEGAWRVGADDEVEVIRGRQRDGKPHWAATGMHSGSLLNFLMGFGFTSGLMPWRSSSPQETVTFVVRQYQWWQKEWDEHRAHKAVYIPAQNGGGRHGFFLNLQPRQVTVREQMARPLPGLGFDKLRFVNQWFGSAREMASAGPETWAAKEWKTKAKNGTAGRIRKLGKATAVKIVEALRGKD